MTGGSWAQRPVVLGKELAAVGLLVVGQAPVVLVAVRQGPVAFGLGPI